MHARLTVRLCIRLPLRTMLSFAATIAQSSTIQATLTAEFLDGSTWLFYLSFNTLFQPKAREALCFHAMQFLHCMSAWSGFWKYNYKISYLHNPTGSWSHKTETIKISCVLPQDILRELMRDYQTRPAHRFIPKPCLQEINTSK